MRTVESNTCLTEVCGDGIVNNGTEQCDDGNNADNDGCSASCQVEFTEVEANNDAATANPFTDPFFAEISVAGDFDYVFADMTAGQTITVTLTDLGNGACASNTVDSELRIFDVDGATEVAFDDNGGVGWCSLVGYTAPVTGRYYVRAAASQQYAPDDTFLYRLLVNVN